MEGKILAILNSLAYSNKWLKIAVILFANYLEYFLIAFFAVFCLAYNQGRLFWGALASAVFARFLVNEIIYLLWKRERPFEKGIKQLVKSPKNPSFPSGHSSFYWAGSFFILFQNYPLGIIFVSASFLMTLSRAIGGIHWLSDILAGGIIGLLSSVIITQII